MFEIVRRLSACAGVVVLMAGCQSVPTDYAPDPKLKSASVSQLKAKVVNACVMAQRAKASATTPELSKKCGCYANGAFKAMSKADVEFYRSTGYFSDEARPAAQKALGACGLS